MAAIDPELAALRRSSKSESSKNVVRVSSPCCVIVDGH
jgi:hypothetical protein